MNRGKQRTRSYRERWLRKSEHLDKWMLWDMDLGYEPGNSELTISKRPRRNHSPIFIAKVAVDAIKGD